MQSLVVCYFPTKKLYSAIFMKKEYGAKYIYRIFPNIVRTVIVAAPPVF